MTFRQTWEAARTKALEAHKAAVASGTVADQQAFVRAAAAEKRARNAYKGKGRI